MMNRKNNQQYSSIPVSVQTTSGQVFPASRIRAFIMFVLLLILMTLIAVITAIAFIIYGILPDWAAIAVSLFIFLFGIIYSEGMWFGLTCSRFATLTNDRLVLYGAFGRERFSCPTDWTFEYRVISSRGLSSSDKVYLRAISPDCHVYRFRLDLCRDEDTLLKALQAQSSEAVFQRALSAEYRRLFATMNPLGVRFLKTISVGFYIITVLAFVSYFFVHPFKLTAAAWQLALLITLLILLPSAWMVRKVWMHETVLGLPAHHYRRRSVVGRITAAIIMMTQISLIILVLGFISTWSLASILGPASLIGSKFETVEQARFGSVHDCGRGCKEVPVCMPAGYEMFEGYWQISYSNRIRQGGTVCVRESKLAYELYFDCPAK
ncbi:hypothetical protein [Neisseria elongata]|uniref:hypothetical protein n=1 Tax=Neisseria elongata TaxID=495 RepID=UPI0024B15584|nr:hypothetical protein [Neisseria elongata]